MMNEWKIFEIDEQEPMFTGTLIQCVEWLAEDDDHAWVITRVVGNELYVFSG